MARPLCSQTRSRITIPCTRSTRRAIELVSRRERNGDSHFGETGGTLLERAALAELFAPKRLGESQLRTVPTGRGAPAGSVEFIAIVHGDDHHTVQAINEILMHAYPYAPLAPAKPEK